MATAAAATRFKFKYNNNKKEPLQFSGFNLTGLNQLLTFEPIMRQEECEMLIGMGLRHVPSSRGKGGAPDASWLMEGWMPK